MLFEVFLICIGLVWLIFASVQDLKKREVANWVSFSLIFFVLGFRFFYSLFFESFFEMNSFYHGVIFLGVFFVLGNLFYYARVFGGGDAKLLVSLGVVLPIFSDFFANFLFCGIFVLGIFLVGSLYGLFWMISYSVFRYNEFIIGFRKVFGKNKQIFFAIFFLGIFPLLAGLGNKIFFYFAFLMFFLPFLYSYAKTIEEVFFVKEKKISELVEGDLLEKDVLIGKKLVKASWEGLSEKDIQLLKKGKKDFVYVREGIPFVPVFLICFILLVFGVEYFKEFFLEASGFFQRFLF